MQKLNSVVLSTQNITHSSQSHYEFVLQNLLYVTNYMLLIMRLVAFSDSFIEIMFICVTTNY